MTWKTKSSMRQLNYRVECNRLKNWNKWPQICLETIKKISHHVFFKTPVIHWYRSTSQTEASARSWLLNTPIRLRFSWVYLHFHLQAEFQNLKLKSTWQERSGSRILLRGEARKTKVGGVCDRSRDVPERELRLYFKLNSTDEASVRQLIVFW